jgi:hypothetical protein
MFDGLNFPKPLDEELFDSWLEKGRESHRRYRYLLVIWDELESEYKPVYKETREELEESKNTLKRAGNETLVAAYDLYSESRVV